MDVIDARELSYEYDDGTLALKNVSLSVREHEAIAIVGPNGAGKSTLIQLLAGLKHAKTGKIRLFDEELTRKNINKLRGRLGVVFQDPDDQLFMPQVWDDIAFGPINLGCDEADVRTRVAEAIRTAGLAGLEERVPHHLSYGEKKRVALAGVLAMRPGLLFLDEPSSNLDPRARREMICMLAQLEATMLIASHDIEMLIETCDRAVVLDRGAIVAVGDIYEILTDTELLRSHGLEAPTVIRLFGAEGFGMIKEGARLRDSTRPDPTDNITPGASHKYINYKTIVSHIDISNSYELVMAMRTKHPTTVGGKRSGAAMSKSLTNDASEARSKASEPDFLVREVLSELDPDMDSVIKFEEGRQARKLILIASESLCPRAVKDVLGSVFTNLYAEGYPPLRMTQEERDRVLAYDRRLAYFRRYADRRYYKGCEYVNFIEALAQLRVAELFATKDTPPEHIYANVQPHSGAPANNAVYAAFLEPGDVIMGIALDCGGHLTHGSDSNRSGQLYRAVQYEVDGATGKLDYDAIRRLALEHRPKLIIAGYSAYPWDIDWAKFREIADAVGALLLADIAHTAGLIAVGVCNNPIGYADVVTFTTHKTLCGPRGGVILTTDPEKAALIDNAVFPVEQGGAHFNNIAAKAVAFKIAQGERFKALQRNVVENARYLGEALEGHGLKLAYGGTRTHLVLIDLKSLKTPNGEPLTGEIASRILDLCGITCNKNTVAGDENAAHPTALRLGLTILTQRGITKAQLGRLASLIYKVLANIHPFFYFTATGNAGRGKIELELMEEIRHEVAKLELELSRDCTLDEEHGYPHYYPLSGENIERRTPLLRLHKTYKPTLDAVHGWQMPLHYGAPDDEANAVENTVALLDLCALGLLEVTGDEERVVAFLDGVCTNDVHALQEGACCRAFILDRNGQVCDDVTILRLRAEAVAQGRFILVSHPANTEKLKCWLRALSDGYVMFDDDDIYAKVEGPVVIEDLRLDVPEERRAMALGLYGPKASALLKALGLESDELRPGRVYEGELRKGLKVLVVMPRYAEKLNVIELYLRQTDAVTLWKLLLKTSKTLGLKRAGWSVFETVRGRAGLPDYGEHGSRPSGNAVYERHASSFALDKPYFIGQRRIKAAHDGSGTPKTMLKKEFEFAAKATKPKRTCLHDEHLKLTKKLVPFAGWEMPVLYSSIAEEHQAVRNTAGLFDVSHMGVLEVSGEHATRFLDIVTSNYVKWLRPGQSQYSYLLDPSGMAIDDIFVYRLALDRYMLVVNAVNAAEDLAWLNAVNSAEVVIDRTRPWLELGKRAVIRDLKAESSGKARKIDIALQGPCSLAILREITDDKRSARRLSYIGSGAFIYCELNGVVTMISRTGYTGEKAGYELYVHPNDAPALWRVLLDTGERYGIKPCGLGARDSTRIEAGLPLYGHELAGKYDITPINAGYGAFVKYHKPYFIGRDALLSRTQDSRQAIARFRMMAKGVRLVKYGDPIVDRHGKHIGNVTSCALVEGYQLGMAYIDRRYATEGTSIGIFSLPRTGKASPEKPKDKLELGDRSLLHEPAVILSRFPDVETDALPARRNFAGTT